MALVQLFLSGVIILVMPQINQSTNNKDKTMNNNTYSVSIKGEYRDVSKTERGAKNYATRNDFNEVYIRFNNGYHIALIATKINNNWVKD